MKTLLYINITLLLIYRSNCYIDFDDKVPITKSQCRKDNQIQKIEAQIKYLQIFQFFGSEFFNDREQYFLIKSQYEQIKNESKYYISKLKDLLDTFDKFGFKSYQQIRLKDNLNPRDKKAEQEYKNLFKINQFLSFARQSIQQLILERIGSDFLGVVSMYNLHFDLNYIKKLKNDYYICTGQDFQDFQDLFLMKSKYICIEDNIGKWSPINYIQLGSDKSNLENNENKIKIEDCPQKIDIIQSFTLEYQKLRNLYDFKSTNKSRSKEEFKQLQELLDQFIIDFLPFKEKLQRILIKDGFEFKYDKLRQLLKDEMVNSVFRQEFDAPEMDERFNSIPYLCDVALEAQQIKQGLGFVGICPLSEIYKEILEMYQDMKNYIELLSSQFFNLDKQYFQELHQSVDSLSSYIEDFQYQEDYIQRGIQSLKRDEDICKSEIQKQNLAKECKSIMENIEQKIYQYQQANELNRFVSNDTNYEILFGTMTSLNKQISESIKKMEEYQQRFMISDKLYFVQVYPSHLHPEDLESVKAYENLLKLQKLIGIQFFLKQVFLQNAFTKADEFLDYKDQFIISYYQDQYQSLKKSINDKVYLQNYSWTKVEEQLHQLYKDYEKCSNRKYNQINQDNSNIENYYWFEKQFSPRNPFNLIILPNVIEQFDKDDISDYSKMSEQCAADIEGIVEDIFETLMIIELLKYKEQGQNQFDQMILQAMSFQEDFLLQARKLFFDIKLPEKMRYFNYVSKQSIDQELQDKFDKLHDFNDQLGQFVYSYQNSMDLLQFNSINFNEMKRTQGIVNNYFTKQKYQLKDKQKELLQLYGEYKACTGQEFLFDFCQSYEEQNIYGGICQQSCFYEPKKLNAIQVDVKIQQKHNNNKKLHQQKSKEAKKSKNKQNHNKFK